MSVVVRGVVKTFPGRRGAAPVAALHPVDLDVGQTELVVVVGPSGSGKSTLLRVIAGLETPERGTVRIGDRDVTALPPGARDVALVSQEPALFPHLRIADNIGFGERARGTPRAEVRGKVAAAAEALGIAGALERRPHELSGGERQRVALARALVREPAAFLMDEPLSALDAELRLRMRIDIKDLQRRLGVALLYVTHDQHEALALGDRVAVLDGGRLLQVAPPRELYERPGSAFVARFIGALPMNLLPAGDAGEAVLGVRPERIRTAPADRGRASGRVLTVEPAGEECLAHIAVPGAKERVLARLPWTEAPEVGAETGLDWDDRDVHRFNGADGRRTG
ncbi:ABC transporter ATP-binding protein [Actinomadura sp. HBU206391]|uniref:ABC transporter ATP-binding protein n=1 Tax=Actinomadura sp. HBU206391 TaxID=2731692 RepID=UPI00164F6B28|nr:ABC transporter ATP-binding protein [Actinomadura sp. HBU206391]MBC6460448.1 ABC transporter ATP-binding protein [Actinomadura sp. HBU206391]